MWNDLRLAARQLAHDRGFTTAAVTALAVGMSATITMFTLVHGVYLRDLPFADPDRIVTIGVRDLSGAPDAIDNLSFPDLQALQTSARLFDGIAAADESSMDLADDVNAPERLNGAHVSASAFALLGHRPTLGRAFTSEDDRPGAEPVVILGHAVWQRRYASDPDTVGRRVRVNGITSTIVGVMPEGFGFPTNSQLWLPLALRSDESRDRRDARNIDTFGRLAPGVSLEQAEADLATVMARLARDFPETNAGIVPRVRPFRDLNTSGPLRTVFAGLMGAAAFLLLIACSNVANLLLARAATRAREITLRLSLGATRRQIVRQLLAESLLLALVAGSAGLALAAAGVRLVRLSVTGTGEPYWLQFPMEGGVFAFVAAVCLGTTVLCGLAPALHGSRVNLNDVLNETGRSAAGAVRARRWADAFVALQLALSLTMLTAAGLTMRNAVAASQLDAGVDTTGLVTARLNLPASRYSSIEQRRVFYRQLEERLPSLTGMRAGITSAAPLGGAVPRDVSTDGDAPRSSGRAEVSTVAVGPGYLETLGLRASRGRLFARSDDLLVGRVAVVNERFASLHFPAGDAIGRSIRLRSTRPGEEPGEPFSIIGVVPNVRQTIGRQRNFDARTAEPVVYLPYAATAPSSATILVRSNAGAAAVASVLREAIGAIDADLPLLSVLPLDEALRMELRILGVFSGMFGLFAAAALAMAAIGLYAVTAYAVTQRTREVGVRMALGARASHIWWLVTRRACVQVSLGLALGLGGAIGAGQLLQGLLWSVSGRDPLTLAGAPALMTIVALLASFIPARRAMQLDPSVALRAD